MLHVVIVGERQHLMVTIAYLFQVTSVSIMYSVQTCFEVKSQLQDPLVYNFSYFQ